MRNSALASAALTSVALLAQTANAAPSAGDETPSREEVSRRVSSLYDQAESDTGTFNATRAAATVPRGRADRPKDTGRRLAAAPRNDDGRRGAPARDSVARQWFDVARSKLGPTVPAALPADRMPDRPAGARAVRTGDGLTDRGREATGGGAAAELPAASGTELTSGSVTGTAPIAELTAGPVAALPAAPEGALGAVRTAQDSRSDPTALALPAPLDDSTGEPQQQSALRASKERNQQKLSLARELLSSYAAQQSGPLPVIESLPAALEGLPAAGTWSAAPPQVQPSTETRWEAPQPQGPADLTTVPARTSAWTTTAEPATDPLAITATSQVLTTGSPYDTTGSSYDTGRSLDTPQAYATGQTDGTGQIYGIGQTDGTGQIYGIGQTDGTGQIYGIEQTDGTSHAYDTGQLPATSQAAASQAPTGQVLAPSTALTATAPQDTRAVRVLDFARAQLGKPCVWGTSGPDAYDGPGLTQAAWKAAGISLPRTAPEQATAGQGVALAHLEPGDLVLFHVGHVGIYSGNGMMIHAPGPGAAIREESIHYAGEAAIHSAIRPA